MFDVVVITAANAAQARGYREQLKWRRAHGRLPASLEVRVVPDPGGRRVGFLFIRALTSAGYLVAQLGFFALERLFYQTCFFHARQP